MTVGDKTANSYGWLAKLAAGVPGGGKVTIPTPGFDEQYTDTRYAEATVDSDGAVWRTGQGKVTITFVTSEPYSATVTNLTGVEWPAGASLYVFCPHLLSEGHNQYDLKGQVWDLQQRVLALEGGGAKKPSSAPPSPAAHASTAATIKPKGK
jgi:hypothetical protein